MSCLDSMSGRGDLDGFVNSDHAEFQEILTCTRVKDERAWIRKRTGHGNLTIQWIQPDGIRSGLGQSDLRARKVRARGLMSHDMLAREHASAE